MPQAKALASKSSVSREQIVVRVRDYGKGISPRIARMESSAQLGVGITGMRERVRQLGGDLSITRAEPGTLGRS